jgi:hypothetical protein
MLLNRDSEQKHHTFGILGRRVGMWTGKACAGQAI